MKKSIRFKSKSKSVVYEDIPAISLHGRLSSYKDRARMSCNSVRLKLSYSPSSIIHLVSTFDKNIQPDIHSVESQ
jgi:hypothetical protein